MKYLSQLSATAMLWAVAATATLAQPGLKAGGSFTRMAISNTEEVIGARTKEDPYSTRAGLLAGVCYNFQPNRWLAIRPELQYVQKGAKNTEAFIGVPSGSLALMPLAADIRLHCAELNLSAIVYPVKPVGLLVGGGYTRILSARNQIDLDNTSSSDITDIFHRNEGNVFAGVNARVSSLLQMEAKYQIGLSDNIYKGGTYSGSPYLRNRGFQVAAVLLLPGKN